VAETLATPGDAIDQKYQLTADDAREVQRGRASWYGGQFHGRRTANGETFDKYALTAAHKTLPFGTIVRVRSETLGREVDVRINDRGPFSPGRVIDLSQAAAEVLGLMGAGVTEVSLKVDSRQHKAALPPMARKKTWRRAPAKPADPYRR
jgi:rare lipoprotein A